MMPVIMRMHITQRGPTPRHIRKHQRRLLKEAYQEMLRHWHTEYRPLHFTEQGERRYHMRRRTKKYNKRKERVKGHTLPLVWSGESRDMTEMKTITGTSKGARLKMRAPTLNFRPKGWEGSMREELTNVLKKEQRAMAKEGNELFIRKIREIDDVHREEIK